MVVVRPAVALYHLRAAIAAIALLGCLNGPAAYGQSGSRNVPAAAAAKKKPAEYSAGGVFQQAGPRAFGPQGQPVVVDVQISGTRTIPIAEIRSKLKTRKDRIFDPEVVQDDVRRLTSGMFQFVRPRIQQVSGGVIVVFEVIERPQIGYVKFVGNRGITDKGLLDKTDIKAGDALDPYVVEEARRKIEDFYQTKGFPRTKVDIFEGDKVTDRGVVFIINEGVLQRIEKVRFIGNDPKLVSGARLKTQIQSKPGFLWYFFKGKVDRNKIDEDIDRITAYYRSLGYFSARVGRELKFDSSGKWLTLTFVISEGPRYVVRNVSVAGNQRFNSGRLKQALDLKSGDFYNQDRLNKDINTLKDVYGGYGHVYATIKPDRRFLEEPGKLDLVYEIKEGDMYRVNRVIVRIGGDNPHTRQNVVLNRLSLKPGDIIDTRKINESERRIKASQLFENNPALGVAPRIVIRPTELQESIETTASRKRAGSPRNRNANRNAIGGGNQGSSSRNYRGQSPDPRFTKPGERKFNRTIFTPQEEKHERSGYPSYQGRR